MSLDFTDAQIKTISQDIIELPKIIDFPFDPQTGEGGTGLVQQQENVVLNKDALYTTDQQNKIFSDHWKVVGDSYHLELETLSLNKRTDYSDTDLENGGQSLPPHYTQSHPELVPIVIPTNNGNPIVASAFPENEVPKLDRMDEIIDKYLNGLGGVLDDTLDATWTNGQPVNTVNGTAFIVGSIVLMLQGSNVMLARVDGAGGSCTGETPTGSGVDEATCVANGGTWTSSITLTAISPIKTFTSGATIQDYSTAWSNAQRGRQVSLTIQETAILEMFEVEIDLTFTEVKDFIQSVVDILIVNDDTNPTRKTDNQTYLDSQNLKITEFDTWIVETVNAIDGKYTDSKLPQLQLSFNELRTLNPNRSAQITIMLGSVTDNGGGDVTGDGVYFDLWKFIIIRIAKSGGTLYSWYGMDLAVRHFDTKIQNANSQLEEYGNIFLVKLITADVALGENEVTVENTTELSETDSIKVFDNETPVFSTTIQTINGNIVTLTQSVPSEYLIGNLARLVKEK
jgi:hypothetical protein